MFKIKKIFKSEKGQSLVEFALILPILLLLVFGIVEFGRAFNTYLIVSNASREGARYAVVGAENGEIIDAIEAKTSTLGSVDIFISPEDKSARTNGEDVDIKVSYSLSLITPIVGPLISEDNSLNIESITTMRME